MKESKCDMINVSNLCNRIEQKIYFDVHDEFGEIPRLELKT